MNPRLSLLQTYPFEKLAGLKAGVRPPAELAHIALSIGEPKHAPPPFIIDALRAHLAELDSYPPTLGSAQLRAAAARWLERRFALGAGNVDQQSMVVPCNGTREALFAFAQAQLDTSHTACVAMPNPCYQIYEGAALLAGAQPYFLNTTRSNRFLPELDAVPADVWNRCQLLFLCSPGNPTGTVLPHSYLQHALALADRYDFVIAADECYADLYQHDSQPPPSLLNAALACGHSAFERCVVFHSLSKRSSVPGLRSGFVAGDAALLRGFLQYRSYHGSAMSLPTQAASAAAWSDDAHAAANRLLYREKFARVLSILSPVLDVVEPDGAFYLWPDVGQDDEVFTRELFAAKNLTILPGSYLARDTPHGNPGRGRVRISLVASVDACVDAAQRIRSFIDGHA